MRITSGPAMSGPYKIQELKSSQRTLLRAPRDFDLTFGNTSAFEFITERHAGFIKVDDYLIVHDMCHKNQISPFIDRVVRCNDAKDMILGVFHVIKAKRLPTT